VEVPDRTLAVGIKKPKRLEITRAELYRLRRAVPADKLFLAHRPPFLQTKICLYCRVRFTKKEGVHQYNWLKQRFHSKRCAARWAAQAPRKKRGHYKKNFFEKYRHIAEDKFQRGLDRAILKARAG
jgi:hypothetical protein